VVTSGKVTDKAGEISVARESNFLKHFVEINKEQAFPAQRPVAYHVDIGGNFFVKNHT
jgi:hypothetical protein